MSRKYGFRAAADVLTKQKFEYKIQNRYINAPKLSTINVEMSVNIHIWTEKSNL